MTAAFPVATDRIYASLEYCSVACNSTPGCVSWSHPASEGGYSDREATIFYGACNAVIEYDFKAADGRGSTTRILLGHTDKITCVRCSRDNVVLSCSRDGTCKLWRDGRLLAHMKAEAALMCGDITCWKGPSHWVVAGSSDDTIRVWATETESSARDICILRHGRNTPLCVRFYDDAVRQKLLLFVGWSSCELQILELEETDGDKKEGFREVCLLTGHKDWIRDIDVRPFSRKHQTRFEDEILVASCAQDSLIRIWKIGPVQAANDDEMEVRKIVFNVGGKPLQAELETVLEGHTGWIYSARWRPGRELRLLTASIDKSMIVWSPTEEEKCDVWIESFRVGDVGGNNLGFMGAIWDQWSGNRILGYGFHGSLHLWRNTGTSTNEWTPCVVPGGHFGPVRGLSWSPRGSYLLTCSSDQTTRLHGKWKRPEEKKCYNEMTDQNNQTMLPDYLEAVWRELARPQVHGHDLSCVAALSETSFVSGAEEKVMRFFNATRNFITNFNRISGAFLVDETGIMLKPEGASAAALGLSNKALYELDLKRQDDNRDFEDLMRNNQDDFYFRPVELTVPPQESTLAQNTLFHEIRKLYGHGYELFTCAASPDGLLVASSCKAQSVKHAAVFLWDTTSWKVVQRLQHHQLTVTCIAFSEDGRKLLTVSRDRTWALWEKQIEETTSESSYVKVGHADKTSSVHQRIIWGCAFAPENFYAAMHKSGGVFATCSRDKKVVIWKHDGNIRRRTRTDVDGCENHPMSITGGWEPALVFTVDDSARCVAFSRSAIATSETKKSLFLAVGVDCGHIEVKLLEVDSVFSELSIVSALKVIAHDLTVNCISFQPEHCSRLEPNPPVAAKKPTRFVELLASCSDDHSVKLHRIYANIREED